MNGPFEVDKLYARAGGDAWRYVGLDHDDHDQLTFARNGFAMRVAANIAPAMFSTKAADSPDLALGPDGDGRGGYPDLGMALAELAEGLPPGRVVQFAVINQGASNG